MRNFMVSKKVRSTLLLLPLLLLTTFPVVMKAEPSKDVELAKQSVQNYIDSINAGDIINATNWVIDTRFASHEEQVEQYKETLLKNPFSNVKIKDFAVNSNNSFTALLELTRKDTKEITHLNLPVINHKGNWKLLINGEETISDSVKEKILLEQGSMDPGYKPLAAVNLGNYDKWLSKSDHTYSGKFDMIGLIIGIAGWQYQPGFSDSRTAVYQVVEKGFFSDDVLGETTKTGYYPQSGDAFYITLSIVNTNTPPSGVYLKVKNPSDISGVAVKGYIYENR